MLDLTCLTAGQRIPLTVSMISYDPEGVQHLTQCMDRKFTKVWIAGSLPRCATLIGIDLLVTSISPLKVVADEKSYVAEIPVCVQSDLLRVVDLCCGMGGFASVAHKVGFQVKAGVDQNERWQKLFNALHPDAVFCHGDLLDFGVLKQLIDLRLFHAVMCSGIACQPHSVLGDRKGMADPRAQSLPRSLTVAWLMQAAVLILECTPEVLRDSQAQELLKQFTLATGFRMAQTVLRLSDAWCCRRDRWIAVLTAPVLPVCELPMTAPFPEVQVVSDLIAEFGVWHDYDQSQIVLNLYELAKYYQYAAGGIQNAFLKPGEKLPTLLHSAGNQLYTCACGCRAALSEQRLSQKGLIGVLVPLGDVLTHMNIQMQQSRYLHPLEMWVLMGGSPDTPMGLNMRLAMAGVGQAVSPMMGLWIFAHVRCCLATALNWHSDSPVHVLHEYATQVLQACRAKWPVPVPPTVVEQPDDILADDPIEDVYMTTHVVTVSWPATQEPDLQIAFTPGATAQMLLDAESNLGASVQGFQVRVDGEPAETTVELQHQTLVTLVPADWTSDHLFAPRHVPCCLDIDEFLRHVRVSGQDDLPVVDIPGLSLARQPNMSKMERESLLAIQGPVWGDDEILFGLKQVANDPDTEPNVMVWDPLLITGLVQHPASLEWKQLVMVLPPECTVISAALLGGHWIPLVWRIDEVEVKLHTLTVAPECASVLLFLSGVVQQHRGGPAGLCQPHGIGFVPTGHCGALTLAFIHHLIWAWPMITDAADLDLTAQSLRLAFQNFLPDPCVRPCLAGLGVSCQSRLVDVLQKHGVPPEEASVRAQSAMKALGEEGVAKALDSDNPWRDLKWLGNQVRPPFMFVKPSELQQQIERRAQDQPYGRKQHKHAKTKGKGKGKQPFQPAACVDPASLRLESGLFQSEAGQPLSQLGLAQVGSSAAGVVVASESAVEPYLKAAHPISSAPLAFFIVDAVRPPMTQFKVTSERIPLVCVANSEPLLVDGFLVQLGSVMVQRVPMQVGCEVQSIPTCVVKALIFRDQTTVPWHEVVAHPLLHLFAKVPPLQSCSDEECSGCECWHKTLDFPLDTPVMELWGKQWMRLDFRACAPADAEVFTAHLRLPESLQLQVQHFSGHDGVFLEPKSLDGRRPSSDFQVVWMPKADHAQLMVQRQTVPHVIGLARMGTKLGLRCQTIHAAMVFATVRPGQTFLPAGKRMTFLVGPFAFGTLQSSVAQVLQANGWTAKPVQAVAAKSHVQGLMFKVQSVQDPPMKMIRMAHGDVVIAKEEEEELPVPTEPKVVATSSTVSRVSRPWHGDVLQQNDPWAKAASKLQAKAATSFQIGNPLEDVAQKVLAEVLQQLPKQHMEVDSDSQTDKRVTALEHQLHDLHGQTQNLVMATQQSAQDTTAQLQELRGQLHQQGQHFESAIATQATALQGVQESFQEQFRQQVSHQQTMLDSMFSKQMSQFETLLAKRHRPE